jgi:hypothetical protein
VDFDRDNFLLPKRDLRCDARVMARKNSGDDWKGFGEVIDWYKSFVFPRSKSQVADASVVFITAFET